HRPEAVLLEGDAGVLRVGPLPEDEGDVVAPLEQPLDQRPLPGGPLDAGVAHEHGDLHRATSACCGAGLTSRSSSISRRLSMSASAKNLAAQLGNFRLAYEPKRGKAPGTPPRTPSWRLLRSWSVFTKSTILKALLA